MIEVHHVERISDLRILVLRVYLWKPFVTTKKHISKIVKSVHLDFIVMISSVYCRLSNNSTDWR